MYRNDLEIVLLCEGTTVSAERIGLYLYAEHLGCEGKAMFREHRAGWRDIHTECIRFSNF